MKLKNMRNDKPPKQVKPVTRLPENLSPQLATLVKTVPNNDDWLHETKYDGYRIICIIDKKIKLLTRGQQDWTQLFPDLVEQIAKLNLKKTILDGEVVAFDERQMTNFQRLQNALKGEVNVPLFYYVFDLPFYDGYDLTTLPLLERKKILRNLIPKKKTAKIRYSDHTLGKGSLAFEQACTAGQEGIISKEVNSPYVQSRTRHWLKIKCIHEQEFVICGFTQPQGTRKHFGSLLLGYYVGKKLHYCGHVGTGFSEASLIEIADQLKKYQTDKMPFAEMPPLNRRTFWVKPKLVAQIEFREWTTDNILRHASFKGLRFDKPAQCVFREKE